MVDRGLGAKMEKSDGLGNLGQYKLNARWVLYSNGAAMTTGAAT